MRSPRTVRGSTCRASGCADSSFGLEFTPAPLLWSSANLVNPLVVGASLGSASVGY